MSGSKGMDEIKSLPKQNWIEGDLISLNLFRFRRNWTSHNVYLEFLILLYMLEKCARLIS